MPLLLVLALTAAAAQIGETPATVTVTAGGNGVGSVIEIETDPAVTRRHELTLFLNRRGSGERTLSFIVPPLQPGHYRLETELAAGAWNLALRYGLGLDLYYAFTQIDIDPSAAGGGRRFLLFERDLGDGVPALAQPLGFALFGLLATSSLVLVAVVLRRMRRETVS